MAVVAPPITLLLSLLLCLFGDNLRGNCLVQARDEAGCVVYDALDQRSSCRGEIVSCDKCVGRGLAVSNNVDLLARGGCIGLSCSDNLVDKGWDVNLCQCVNTEVPVISGTV